MVAAVSAMVMVAPLVTVFQAASAQPWPVAGVVPVSVRPMSGRSKATGWGMEAT